MNIGDIWFQLRGEDAGLQVDAQKAGQAAGEGFGNSFGGKMQSAFGTGGMVGVGLAAGAMAFNALGASVQGAVGFLQDAVKASMEDEASQAKLASALTANVKGWDGNSKAIEDVLKARMMLGFSDEAQRDSLAVLVARTGDVTVALDIERAAMDLARLKGVDLAAASKAIALGMGGQGRALKELGINVKDYASANEILAAIQAKASGQAEAYANTTAGAMEGMQLQIEEATKAIGYRLLPVVKELAFFIRDNAVPAVEYLGGVVERLTFAASLLSNPMGTAQNEVMKMQIATALAAQAAAEAAAKIDEMTMAQRRAASGGAEATEAAIALGDQFWTVGTASADAAFHQKGYADATRLIAEWSQFARAELPSLAQAFRDTAAAARANRLDAAYGLAELPLQVQVATAAVVAAAKVVKENPLNPQAKIDLLEAQKNLDQYMALLKAEGKNGAIIAAGVGAQIASGLYKGVIDWRPGAPAGPATTGGNRNVDIFKAAGGPVTAGMPYIVGERRAELFVPNEAGKIIPQVPTGGSGSSGAPPVTITTGDIIIQAGSLAGSEAEARVFARSIFDRLEDEAARRGRVLAPVR